MRTIQSSNFTQLCQSLSGFFRVVWRWCCQLALVQPKVSSYFEPITRLLDPNYRSGLSSAQLLAISQQHGFVQLQLKTGRDFRGFLPGQHLDLTVELDGALVTRTFSISSPLQQFLTDRTVQLTLKVQSHAGLTKQLAATANPNLPCYISQASGEFVLEQTQCGLILAAGSGITPVHSMLSSLSRLTQPITLIYSYRGEDQLLFARTWPELQARFPLLKIELRDSSRQGRLTSAEFSEALLALKNRVVQQAPAVACEVAPVLYLCGPKSFSEHWQQQAIAHGLTDIRQESFGLPLVGNNDDVTVVAQQHGRTVQLQSRGNLLLSLEQAGLSPRYGCRRGICMQCLCQKKSGQVRNELTGQHSDSGAGLVQLCISTALTPLELQLDAVTSAIPE